MATCVLAAAILALATPPARATEFTWDGNFNTLWDRTSAEDRTNWDPQGMSSPIPNWNDNVFFGPIDAPITIVDLNGNRTVLSATFSGSESYTLIGSGDRLKLSTGNLTADNSYTGVTTISGGALQIGDGGTDLFITYAAGDGNDIALSTVPEPGTFTFLVLGLASLCFVRRRRKR